jgi:hypothetical protein
MTVGSLNLKGEHYMINIEDLRADRLVTLFAVQISGRGGDDENEEYFMTEKDAILASALDGKDRTPRMVAMVPLSDGHFMFQPAIVTVSPTPDHERVEVWKAQRAARLTPAERLFLKVI